MAVFKDEETIKEMKPDFEKLKQLKDIFGVIVTARGRKYDFVSRYFAPGIGVPEDPVTGSAHCTLIPYWAEKLGKEHLRAYQLSKRGGEIFCRYHGERVQISGQAALYAKGEICL